MSDDRLYPPNLAEPNLGDQMDPLGTAGAAAPSAPEPAPAAANVKIGKVKKEKKKLSTKRKVAYGVGGVFAALLGLVVIADATAPKVEVYPQPTAAMATAGSSMMGATPDEAATVMGGAPAGAPAPATAPEAAVAPAPSPAAAASTHAAAAIVAAAGTTVAPSPNGAQPVQMALAQPQAAAAPAPAPVPAKASTPASPSEQIVLAKAKPEPSAKAATPTRTEADLAARVAMLERRLARYERAEAQERARAKAAARRAAAVTPAPVQHEKLKVVAQVAPEPKKPVILSDDSVRVIGMSTRHGVTSALVDFGGVKHRVSRGESLPGLGTVQNIAVDAAGNPVVEVNGVRYQ